jgi:NDP-sugar pyrophosphorylase family protein
MEQDKLGSQLFDWQHSIAGDLLREEAEIWRAIPKITTFILQLIAHLPDTYQELKPGVWVGPETEIAPTALIQGPAIIGARCQIRHNAFVRNQVICGDEVVIGNATEVKNAILFDGVQVPHFNYVGDSILGYKAHLGAGAIISNYKAQGDEIHLWLDGQKTGSGLNKMGVLLGDDAEVGCNAVLYPGTIVGRRSIIYPLSPVRGTIPADTIVKGDGRLYPRH